VAWILIVFLILLGGLIAPFGDILGTKIGKARFSILKLRPKKTATIITIITGGFISSISIGLLILVSEEFRQRLFVDIPFLQKTLDESKKALVPLQEEQKKLESKIIQKEKELNLLKNNYQTYIEKLLPHSNPRQQLLYQATDQKEILQAMKLVLRILKTGIPTIL